MSRKSSVFIVAVIGLALVACNKEKKASSESKQEAKPAAAAPAKSAEPAKEAKTAEPAKEAKTAEPANEAKTAEPAAAPAGKTSGSVVGTYVIDKDAVKAQMQAAIAKMPKEKRGMAGMMMKLIDMIQMEVTLKEGGVVSIKETKPNFGKKKADKPQVKEIAGKWAMEGDKVKISTVEKKTIVCDVEKDKLSCSKGKPGPFKMVLKRS